MGKHQFPDDGDLPAPMTPPGSDLRHFGDMPLEVDRVLRSALATIPNHEARWLNVVSWCVSWHEVPAASLPNDETQLAHRLGYGDNLRRFRAVVEAGGLRGWVLCSDGLLYHPVVAEKALEALGRKTKATRAAEARWSGSKKVEPSTNRGRTVRERPTKAPRTKGQLIENVQPDLCVSNAIERRGEDKERKSTLPSEESPKPVSDARMPPEAEVWNLLCGATLGMVRSWSALRKRKLAARVKDELRGIGWEGYCRLIAASPFLAGQSERGWKADLDWCLEPQHAIRIIEGRYQDRRGGPQVVVPMRRPVIESDAFASLLHDMRQARTGAEIEGTIDHGEQDRRDHPGVAGSAGGALPRQVGQGGGARAVAGIHSPAADAAD
jgi:hypothetical protein